MAAPAGRPKTVPSDELPGHGDPSAWQFVVIWLAALLLAGLAFAWIWTRFGRWQSWLIGAPVLLAVGWGLSAEILRLLPNLY